MYSYYVAYLYIKFVNMIMLNDIASVFIYVCAHIYRVLSNRHTHIIHALGGYFNS